MPKGSLGAARRAKAGGCAAFATATGDVPDSSSLQICDSTAPEGGLWVKCWVSCNRRTIIAALEDATVWSIWNAREDFRLGVKGSGMLGHRGGASQATPPPSAEP